MKGKQKNELIIGALVLLALALLIVGIDFLKGINVFKAANYYYVEYTNVDGLAVSAPVHINGFKVGLVREIGYEYDNPGHVKVEISLNKELQLPVGTKAVLTTDILGTSTIALRPGNPADGMCEVGDMLDGLVDGGIMSGISGMMPSVEAIFPKIDTLLTNLNTLIADPSLATSVKRLDDITANLSVTSRRLSDLMASLPPVVSDVKTATANIDSITVDMAELSAKLKQVPVDSLTADLAATLANLNELSGQLKNPDGSLGKLITNPELYDNLNTAISNLDSLLVDVKRNPKRYVRIKMF